MKVGSLRVFAYYLSMYVDTIFLFEDLKTVSIYVLLYVQNMLSVETL